MTFSDFGFSPRILSILPLTLLTLPAVVAAQGGGDNDRSVGFHNATMPGVVLIDDFDDPAATAQNWGLESSDAWSEHFVPDGSGGFALLFVDEDDNGGGQDGNPNVGATLPPTQSGGGWTSLGKPALPTYHDGFFRFELELDAQPQLVSSPRMRIFALNEPSLKIELKYVSGVWSYRVVEGINPVNHWVAFPVGTTSTAWKIEYLSANSLRVGELKVNVAASSHNSATSIHNTNITSTTFPKWSTLFLGMRTPVDESVALPVVSSTYSSNWLTAMAFDNFGAFSERQAWLNN